MSKHPKYLVKGPTPPAIVSIEKAPPMEGWSEQWYVVSDDGYRISTLYNSVGEARMWARRSGYQVKK